MMVHPGWTFGVMLAVAIGTAIYYYFNNENPRLNYVYEDPYHPSAPSLQSNTQSPRRRNSNDFQKNCVICFDVLKADSSRRLSCGHKFHESCINRWLSVNNSCPICRKTL
ncbi:hypothetical protein RI129_001479 [Pyrocoelia pectoralis]|uniref:RING-type domain-containing protein n=1 Tax=Pyrocoelia pectoralis TaxID=417401 RepID=A0AAN7ZK13_9COLE